jgi:hypothetical protein
MTLTARTLAEILLKVWAVTLVVHGLLGLAQVISQFMSPLNGREWRIVASWNLVPLILTLVAGITLLKFSPAIARRLDPAPSTGEHGSQMPLPSASLAVVAFGVLGASFLVEGLRDLASALFQLATKPSNADINLNFMWQQSPQAVIGAAVQTVAGLALLLGREGIAHFAIRVRETPHPPDGSGSDGDPTPRNL